MESVSHPDDHRFTMTMSRNFQELSNIKIDEDRTISEYCIEKEWKTADHEAGKDGSAAYGLFIHSATMMTKYK